MTMSGSPPFTVTLCADGTMVWEVHEPISGQRLMIERATPDQAERLEAAFDRADFLDLGTDFSHVDYTCQHWYSIYWHSGDHWKLVRYYGGDESAPRACGDA